MDIEKLNKELRKISDEKQKMLLEHLTNAIEETTKELFNNKYLVALGWTQNVPMFNDGDVCEFGIGEFFVVMNLHKVQKETGVDKSDFYRFIDDGGEFEEYCGGEFEGDEYGDAVYKSGLYGPEWYANSRFINEIKSRWYNENNDFDFEQFKDAFIDASVALHKIHEIDAGCFEEIFDSNAEVIISRDGVSSDYLEPVY